MVGVVGVVGVAGPPQSEGVYDCKGLAEIRDPEQTEGISNLYTVHLSLVQRKMGLLTNSPAREHDTALPHLSERAKQVNTYKQHLNTVGMPCGKVPLGTSAPL